MLVRAAVLKGKDPLQLIDDLHAIDDMGNYISIIDLYVHRSIVHCFVTKMYPMMSLYMS